MLIRPVWALQSVGAKIVVLMHIMLRGVVDEWAVIRTKHVQVPLLRQRDM